MRKPRRTLATAAVTALTAAGAGWAHVWFTDEALRGKSKNGSPN
ncbi:hypothetical protein [Streptomyces albiflavescens]|nr:hypothetical protein [Streptomyces albiflavescens]